ncbi:hypothetical protein ACTQ3M_09900 [Oscillospiraceae bacterium LCP25S3_E10]|nr:hypothetical protein [Ruminococcus sp.]MDD6447215.1 hypothetical protein [Ruminococcus sp.]MDY2855892.1 hypothetical protein [Oscillospiraceae bacterium]
MKILQKSVAAVAAALIAGSALAGCTQATIFGSYPQDLSWSYKDDASTLSIGGYIYYNYSAFTAASQKVENGTGDFLDQKLKNDDGKEVTAKEYIDQVTEDACKNYIYVNKVFKDKKLSLTAEEISSYKKNADSYWTYYKTVFEKLGVSKDSFVSAGYENSAKLEAIFKSIYGEGGEKEVSTADMQKYYEDNYVNYSYLSVPLYDTSTDSNNQSTNTKKSDADIKKIKSNLEKYAADINNGTSYADEVKVYMKDYNIQSDPTISATNILKNAGLGEDIEKAIESLKDGQAKYITVGEGGDSATCYLIYRGNIKDESKKLASDENTKYSVLVNMKSEEFQKDMKEQAKNVKCEVNTAAIEKYPCTNYITEPATEAATNTASADSK